MLGDHISMTWKLSEEWGIFLANFDVLWIQLLTHVQKIQ